MNETGQTRCPMIDRLAELSEFVRAIFREARVEFSFGNFSGGFGHPADGFRNISDKGKPEKHRETDDARQNNERRRVEKQSAAGKRIGRGNQSGAQRLPSSKMKMRPTNQ